MCILKQLAVAKHTCELFYEILCVPFRIVSWYSVKNGLIYLIDVCIYVYVIMYVNMRLK